MSRPISQPYPYGLPISSGVLPDGQTVDSADFAPLINSVSDGVCDILGDFDYTVVPLLNGWIPYNSNGYDPNFPPEGVRIRRVGQMVFLTGLVKSGTGVLCTLPVGYRPPFTVSVACIAGVGSAGVVVAPSGSVTPANYVNGGSNAFVALDGVMFTVD